MYNFWSPPSVLQSANQDAASDGLDSAHQLRLTSCLKQQHLHGPDWDESNHW